LTLGSLGIGLADLMNAHGQGTDARAPLCAASFLCGRG
jgi:hypothetical protein